MRSRVHHSRSLATVVANPSRGLLLAAFIAAAALAASSPILFSAAPARAAAHPFPGWTGIAPAGWQAGRLTDEERLFAGGFPGEIGRFSRGDEQLIVRWIDSPTRRLHPSRDCLRGVGYTVRRAPATVDTHPGASRWHAKRRGRSMVVEEWIEDARGETFSEVGHWYWAALLGESTGPWIAYTLSRPARQGGRTARR